MSSLCFGMMASLSTRLTDSPHGRATRQNTNSIRIVIANAREWRARTHRLNA